MSLCLNVGLFVCFNTFFFSGRLSVCLVVRLSDRLHVFLFPYFSVTSLLWAICPCLFHKHILRNSGIPLHFFCFYFTSNVLSYPSYLCLYDEVIRSAQILGSVFSLTKHQPYAWLLYKGCFASIASFGIRVEANSNVARSTETGYPLTGKRDMIEIDVRVTVFSCIFLKNFF